MLVGRVWRAEDEGVDACHRSESGNVAYCVIETDRLDQVAEHAGVDYACYTGTTSHIAYSKTPALRKPC